MMLNRDVLASEDIQRLRKRRYNPAQRGRGRRSGVP